MTQRSIRARQVAGLGLGLVLLAPLQAARAFGELDVSGVGHGCTSFTTCSATTYSHAYGSAVYQFNNLVGSYVLPQGLTPGYNSDQSERSLETTTLVTAGAGQCSTPGACGIINAFASSAFAKAQTNFGVNRALAESSFGANGQDTQTTGNAQVRVTTGATADSVWRDAWTFSTSGHFNATIRADGQSSRAADNLGFPSTFNHSPFGFPSEWSFDIKVWDVNRLTRNSDGILGPTQVGTASHLETIAWNESRPSFASVLSLDFNFLAGVQYVVIANLRVNVANGRLIDVFSTARLTDVTLSNGAGLSALSGHDYLAPVPEPAGWALLAGGLGFLLLRRQFERG